MTRATVLGLVGATLALTLLLGCAALSLAVREGAVGEMLYWFPPGQRYQLAVRVGEDAMPWDRRGGRPTAINLWVHGRGTEWHIVNLLRLPIGPPRDAPPGTMRASRPPAPQP